MIGSAVLVALWSAAAAAAVTPAQPAAQVRKIARVDESARDPTLGRLRDDLLAVAKGRDLARLLPLMADTVRVDFDEMPRAQFAEWFAQRSAADQALFWQQLRDAFTLGMAYEPGIAEPTTLIAPYTTVALEKILERGDLLLAITGSGVAVHRDPNPSSPIVERLDHDLVEIGPELPLPAPPGAFDGVYEWLHVKTPSGRLGWVVSKYVRAVNDPRFYVTKAGGVWKVSGYATVE
jgi:hypothetical protein